MDIFENKKDMFRFLDGLVFFNNTETNHRKMCHTALDNRRNQTGLTCLVTIHAYCLLPNHYHLLISCEEPRQLSSFMKKLANGYTGYYHEQYPDHSGTIFQGTYKKVLIESDAQLWQVLAYVNGNHMVHGIDNHKTCSSIHEYFEPQDHVLNSTALVINNFKDHSQWTYYCTSKNMDTQRKRREEKMKHLIE